MGVHPIYADRDLSQRLERAEACANAAFVEAKASLNRDSGATWIEADGAYAMFDTPDSPVTQTFGLGMFAPLTAETLDIVESFFRERNAPVHHEISPHADASVWPLFTERGYTPVEFTNILYMKLNSDTAPVTSHEVSVRVADPAEFDLWAALSAHGWASEFPELSTVLADLGRTVARAKGVVPFLAELDGRPIATGSLNIQNGVALLAGASTVPEARRRGAQLALLNARLHHAFEAGCRVATMGALPGSTSQRNAERSGFQIAYTRTKWRLG